MNPTTANRPAWTDSTGTNCAGNQRPSQEFELYILETILEQCIDGTQKEATFRKSHFPVHKLRPQRILPEQADEPHLRNYFL